MHSKALSVVSSSLTTNSASLRCVLAFSCIVVCYIQVLATQQSLLTNSGCLLRSKGFVWLASQADRVVEWSSSGLLLEVCMAHPWFATVPEVRG